MQLSLLERERRLQPHKSDAERIADISERVIDELEERPPIRLEIVASFRDIVNIRIESMIHAGSLTPEPRGLVMRLRADDSHRRRRFTGFHEVGHTFQPGYREQTLFRCVTPTLPQRPAATPEELADAAAVSLMLPRTHFEPLVLASTFGLSSIVGLADLFDASVQASAYRFASLWPEPTLVLTLEMGLRKEELDDPMAQKKLRVVSAWPYPRGAWIYIPKNKSADEQGSLARAFAGEHVDERAGLEELGLQSPGRLELSARAFTYRSMDGPRRRVVALFRQTEGSING